MTNLASPLADDAPDESLKRRAHKLRAKGLSLRAISDRLGVSHTTIAVTINGQLRGEKSPMVAANDNVRTIEVAHNGGCSTRSGMVEVSLARRVAA